MKKVYWQDPVSVKVGRQEYNGVPFVILGHKVLDCQFGKDRKAKAKEKKKKEKVINHTYLRIVISCDDLVE